MMVLIRPIITEKSLTLATQRQFTFEVDRRANALQVAAAVADQYKVTVEVVRTQNIRGEERRNRKGVGHTRGWKKAIVTLKKGDKIPGFELETEEKPAKADTTDKAAKIEKKTKADRTETKEVTPEEGK